MQLSSVNGREGDGLYFSLLSYFFIAFFNFVPTCRLCKMVSLYLHHILNTKT